MVLIEVRISRKGRRIGTTTVPTFKEISMAALRKLLVTVSCRAAAPAYHLADTTNPSIHLCSARLVLEDRSVRKRAAETCQHN
jgi:hypothetical protein